jgi:hypothetical protein
MPIVPFSPGDGTRIELEVAGISEFPRDAAGTCAFCHGDPCAEEADPNTEIARYYRRNSWAQTCSMCQGRPT